ncbi:MAG: NRDE family protein [Flavobacteriales bacterium]
MCTVTYIPTPSGCLITSNRDEIITRSPAIGPKVYSPSTKEILFPKDPQGGGSWIASGDNMSVCLLNGAFEPHERKDHYKHSRGLVPLAIIEHGNVPSFVEQYDFEGIEPFTVVIYNPNGLWELIWDEERPHLFGHDPKLPGIWASTPLYSPEVRAQRKQWFSEWLDSTSDPTQESILRFHTQPSSDKENGLLIARDNGLHTVSVTSIEHQNDQSALMCYRDLVFTDEPELNVQLNF